MTFGAGHAGEILPLDSSFAGPAGGVDGGDIDPAGVPLVGADQPAVGSLDGGATRPTGALLEPWEAEIVATVLLDQAVADKAAQRAERLPTNNRTLRS